MVTSLIRVLVAEDHENLREQLAILLSDFESIVVVGTAENGQQALDLCNKLHPDVVLMDAQMPVLDGFAATSTIREQFPDTRVVILSNGFLGEEARAESAGASSFLLKPAWGTEIITAIRDAYADIETAP
jgi:DNA-binding NarL/FixJ family response regulator